MIKEEVFAQIEKYYGYLKTEYGFIVHVSNETFSFCQKEENITFYYDDYEHELIVEYKWKDYKYNLLAVLQVLGYCQKQYYSINCWEFDFASRLIREYADCLKKAMNDLTGNNAQQTVLRLRYTFGKEQTYYDAYQQRQLNFHIKEAINNKNYKLAYALLNNKKELTTNERNKKALLLKLIKKNNL